MPKNTIDVNVYPNPSHQSFHITTNEIDMGQSMEMSIYDSRGVLIAPAKKIEKTQTNEFGSGLAPGIYFLHLQQKEFSKIIRIVKL